MLRALYGVVLHLALPLLPLRLWWRGRKEPGYRQDVAQRFGRYGAPAVRSSGSTRSPSARRGPRSRSYGRCVLGIPITRCSSPT